MSESCLKNNISLNNLCSLVERTKHEGNLSSAMRIHALNFYRELVEKYKTQEEII
ncbi:MAG: hypothetical protein J6U64_01335 [Alphaproteobacteria bacterium]|nr:hypothetical protein [Alphaproteobacteria bacterium]